MTAPAPHPAASGAGQAEFVWKDAPDYKNNRLRAYQRMLAARGITKPEDVKLLVAQLIQENGSLSESHTSGDKGCAVGIIQWNACVHAHVSAKKFLALHPEWNDWHYQLEQMANMVAHRYQIYDRDIMRVIVAHNRPASAKAGRDTPAGYFRAVSSRTSLLITL